MAEGKLGVYISGAVSGGLLQGLNALRKELDAFSSSAKSAGKTDVSNKLKTIAEGIQTATESVSQQAGATGDSIRSMFEAIARAAAEYAAEIRNLHGVGDEVSEEMSDMDKKGHDLAESLAMLSRQLSMMNDASIKEASKNFATISDSMDGVSDDAEEQAKSIAILEEAWARWASDLSDPAGLKSAKKALQSLADSIYGTERALKDAGHDMSGWVDSLESDKLQEAFDKGLLKPTKSGFKIYHESAKDFLNLSEEQVRAIQKVTDALSELDKEYQKINQMDVTEGNENYVRSLQKLIDTKGEDTAVTEKWLSVLRKSHSALDRYKAQFDEADSEMRGLIDSTDRYSLVQSALNNDIKVTKDGIKILTKDGLKPFNEMTLDTVDSLDMLSSNLKKSLKSDIDLDFEGVKSKQIKNIKEFNEGISESSSKVSVYKQRLNELQEAEKDNIRNARQMREAYEELASEYADNDVAANKIYKNLKRMEEALYSQTSALKEEDKAYKEIIESMDRVEGYHQVFGKGDNLKITTKGFQALNEEGLRPFVGLTNEAAESMGLMHPHFKKYQEQLKQSFEFTDEWSDSIKKIAGNNKAHADVLDHLGGKYGKNIDSLHRYNSATLQAYKNIHRYVHTNQTYIHQLEAEAKKREAAGRSTTRHRKKIEQYKNNIIEAKKHQSLLNETNQVWNERLGLSAKRTSHFAKEQKKLANQAGALGNVFTAVNTRLKQFAAFVIAALIIQQLTQAIREAVMIISDYDQALHNLQAIIEITVSQSQVLGDIIRTVARDTKFSATEVAEGVRLLGQAGFDMVQAMQALPGVSRLATGTMEQFDVVVDLVTTTVNAFQMQTTRASETADIFANAINNSKLNVDKLNTAFNYVGAAGKQAGLTINQLAGTLMTLADNGIRASTMGTGLRRTLLGMLDPSQDLATELGNVGLKVDDLNPKIVGYQQALKNLAPLIWDFERGMVDMGKASDYFGKRASQVVSILVREAGEGGAIERAIEKTREIGSASEMAATQQEGLGLKLKNLVDRAKNVVLALGDAGLNDVLKAVIDSLRGAAAAAEMFIDRFPVALQVMGVATATLAVTAALQGLSFILRKVTPMLSRFVGVLTGPIGIAAAVATSLIVIGKQVVTFHERTAEAAAKAGEEMIYHAKTAESYGKVLKQAAEEGSEEFSRAVHYMEEDAKEVADSIAQDLGYDTLSDMADGVEDNSEKAIEAMEKLGATVEKISDESYQAAKENITKAMEEIINQMEDNQDFENFKKKGFLDFKQFFLNLPAMLTGSGSLVTSEYILRAIFGKDEEELRALLEDYMERSIIPVLHEALSIKGITTEEGLSDYFEEEFASLKRVMDPEDFKDFKKDVFDVFNAMTEESGVTFEKMHNIISQNLAEISGTISDFNLSVKDKFKLFGEREENEKEAMEYREFLDENFDYTETKLNALANEYKTKLDMQSILGIVKDNIDELTDEFDAYAEERLAQTETTELEEFAIVKNQLESKLQLYKNHYERIKDLTGSEELADELRSRITETEKALKENAKNTEDFLNEVSENIIHNIYDKEINKAEEGSLEQLKIEKEKTEKLLEFKQRILENSKLSVKEEQALQAEIISLQKDLLSQEKDILDKRLDNYDEFYQERMSKLEADAEKRRIKWERLAAEDMVSEGTAILKISDVDVKEAEEQFVEKAGRVQDLVDIYGGVENARGKKEYIQALEEMRDAENNYQQKRIQRIEAFKRAMKADNKEIEEEYAQHEQELQNQYQKRLNNIQSNAVAELEVERERLKELIDLKQEELEKVEGKEAIEKKQQELLSLKEELKDNELSLIEASNEKIQSEIETGYSKRLAAVRNNKLQELAIERERIQELIKAKEKEIEIAVGPDMRREKEKELAALQEELKENEEDILDERAKNINEYVDKVISDYDRLIETFNVDLSQKLFTGEITEDEYIRQKADKQLEMVRKIVETRKKQTEDLAKLYPKTAEEYKDAKQQEKDAALAVQEAELERAKSYVESYQVMYDKAVELAEYRRELATLDLEEEEVRYRLKESSSATDAVIADIEKVTTSTYTNYSRRLDALKEYGDERKVAYEEQINNLLSMDEFDKEEYRRILREKKLFLRKHHIEVRELEEKAFRARIREHGSYLEKIKLGYINFAEEVERTNKDIVDITKEVATEVKDAWNDAFSDFIRGTESMSDAFDSLIDSILDSMADMLAESITQDFIGLFTNMLSGSLFNGMGGLFNGGSSSPTMGADVSPFAMAGPGVYHDGGTVGKSDVPIRMVSAAIFENAKRLHDGLKGLAFNEFPAILKKGETVLPDNFKFPPIKSGPENINIEVVNKGGGKFDVTNADVSMENGNMNIKMVLDDFKKEMKKETEHVVRNTIKRSL
jgi:TP901 family phage tail tape measure protein